MNTQNTYNGHDSVLKGSKLCRATIEMNIEDSMLREISQSRKDKYCSVQFHLYEILRLVKFRGQKVDWWLPIPKRLGNEQMFNGHSFGFAREKVLKICFTTMRIYLALLTHTLWGKIK